VIGGYTLYWYYTDIILVPITSAKQLTNICVHCRRNVHRRSHILTSHYLYFVIKKVQFACATKFPKSGKIFNPYQKFNFNFENIFEFLNFFSMLYDIVPNGFFFKVQLTLYILTVARHDVSAEAWHNVLSFNRIVI